MKWLPQGYITGSLFNFKHLHLCEAFSDPFFRFLPPKKTRWNWPESPLFPHELLWLVAPWGQSHSCAPSARPCVPQGHTLSVSAPGPLSRSHFYRVCLTPVVLDRGCQYHPWVLVLVPATLWIINGISGSETKQMRVYKYRYLKILQLILIHITG